MELTILVVEGCPHAALLEERLAAVLEERLPAAARDRPGPAITRRVVADPDEAARAGLHGSPTVLVDGTDPFAAPGQHVLPAVRQRPRPAGRGAIGQPAQAGDQAGSRPVCRVTGVGAQHAFCPLVLAAGLGHVPTAGVVAPA